MLLLYISKASSKLVINGIYMIFPKRKITWIKSQIGLKAENGGIRGILVMKLSNFSAKFSNFVIIGFVQFFHFLLG